ncbi:hypothetical protein RFI_12446, partial [Reticulomyxa filosa]
RDGVSFGVHKTSGNSTLHGKTLMNKHDWQGPITMYFASLDASRGITTNTNTNTNMNTNMNMNMNMNMDMNMNMNMNLNMSVDMHKNHNSNSHSHGHGHSHHSNSSRKTHFPYPIFERKNKNNPHPEGFPVDAGFETAKSAFWFAPQRWSGLTNEQYAIVSAKDTKWQKDCDIVLKTDLRKYRDAIYNGQSDVMSDFIKRYITMAPPVYFACVSLPYSDRVTTPFHLAVRRGHLHVVKDIFKLFQQQFIWAKCWPSCFQLPKRMMIIITITITITITIKPTIIIINIIKVTITIIITIIITINNNNNK